MASFWLIFQLNVEEFYPDSLKCLVKKIGRYCALQGCFTVLCIVYRKYHVIQVLWLSWCWTKGSQVEALCAAPFACQHGQKQLRRVFHPNSLHGTRGSLVPSLAVGIWALISHNAGFTSFKDILKISYLTLKDVSRKLFIGLFSLNTDFASTEIMDLRSVLFLCMITSIKIIFFVHKADMLKRIPPWLAIVLL